MCGDTQSARGVDRFGCRAGLPVGVAGGAGTARTLAIEAEEIVWATARRRVAGLVRRDGRLACFSSVVLDASRRLTANQRGSLSVYRSQDGRAARLSLQRRRPADPHAPADGRGR